jgi:hypothetical protein
MTAVVLVGVRALLGQQLPPALVERAAREDGVPRELAR